jgi:hypothetical protein
MIRIFLSLRFLLVNLQKVFGSLLVYECCGRGAVHCHPKLVHVCDRKTKPQNEQEKKKGKKGGKKEKKRKKRKGKKMNI